MIKKQEVYLPGLSHIVCCVKGTNSPRCPVSICYGLSLILYIIFLKYKHENYIGNLVMLLLRHFNIESIFTDYFID